MWQWAAYSKPSATFIGCASTSFSHAAASPGPARHPRARSGDAVSGLLTAWPRGAGEEEDGDQIWSLRSGGRITDPVVTGGVAYIASFNNRLYALNA